MNLESIGYLFCYQGQDITFSPNPQDPAIPVCYYWQEPVYTESQVKELISKAGEVMRERSEKVVEEGTAFIPFQCMGYYKFAENRRRAIHAIPAITLEDINK